MTDHERLEAAALGASTRATGGRAELVGGALYVESRLAWLGMAATRPSQRRLRPNWRSA